MRINRFTHILVCSLLSIPCSNVLSAESNGWRHGPVRIREVVPQSGWIQRNAIKADGWRPTAKDDIGAELAQARKLTLVPVARGPQRVKCGAPYLVPNPGGKSWDAVIPYRSSYRGSGEIIMMDMGTGKTNRQTWGDRADKHCFTGEQTDFHMQPSYYTKGKLVFYTWTKSMNIMFLVYDPAKNKFVHTSVPFGDRAKVGVFSLADNGMIYGIAWPKDKSGFVACSFDPETYEAKLYKKFGPENRNLTLNYLETSTHGDWVYASIGNSPWHLLAFNFKTKESKVLASSREIRGDHRTINLKKMNGGVSGTIKDAQSILGISGFSKSSFDFWLHDGKVHKRTNKTPPWSSEPASRYQEGRIGPASHYREFQHWGASVSACLPPEIAERSFEPIDGKGTVNLRYRVAKDQAWKTVTYNVRLYPGVVQRIQEINKDVVFATDDGYGQHVFYDLKAKRLQRLLVSHVSPYSLGLLKNRLFVSGYSNMRVEEYDLSRRFDLQANAPNPKTVGQLGRACDTHCPLAGTVEGADGHIYVAGITYGRRRDGGGLAWYNPGTGIRGAELIKDDRPFWMTSASKGRYILLSTKRKGGGRLFCWDTTKKTFIYQKRIAGKATPGPIVEALPGLILGHAPSGSGGILYGLEAATGSLLWQIDVPQEPLTSMSQVRRARYTFRRGPEGNVWAFFGNVLVKISPATLKITAIGQTAPAQIAFANNGVYIAGEGRLMKIQGLRVRSK